MKSDKLNPKEQEILDSLSNNKNESLKNEIKLRSKKEKISLGKNQIINLSASDLEGFNKQYQNMICRFQPTIKRFQKELNKLNERMQSNTNELLEKYNYKLEEVQENINHLIKMYLPKIKEDIKKAHKWQKEQKIYVTQLAEIGWFPNWHTFNYYLKTFSYHLENDSEEIDNFMISIIDKNWQDIKEKILILVPNREKILQTAFKLHEEENYIASIPLLLSQSDGICSEEFRHFFSKDIVTTEDGTEIKMNAGDEIIKQVENGELAVDFFTEILLEPFKVNLQISSSSSKASQRAKTKGPNRHGIIHGSRKHLDYGTKINGYKALSFLAFIVYTIKDNFKEA